MCFLNEKPLSTKRSKKLDYKNNIYGPLFRPILPFNCNQFLINLLYIIIKPKFVVKCKRRSQKFLWVLRAPSFLFFQPLYQIS